MASPRTARLRHRGDEVARATRCRAPPKRRTTRCSPSGPFRLAVPTEVVEPVRRADRRLPHGRIPPRWSDCARHAAGERRHLPWGSVPFGESSPGDRYVGLPPRHHPPSGFLTLSTVFSSLKRPALFRAGNAHGVTLSRGFPSQPGPASSSLQDYPLGVLSYAFSTLMKRCVASGASKPLSLQPKPFGRLQGFAPVVNPYRGRTITSRARRPIPS